MSEGATVAVLGAGGTMGLPMARHIAEAGMDVRAWNRTRENAEPLAEHGVQVLDTPKDAASSADVVITILSDAEAFLETISGGPTDNPYAQLKGRMMVERSFEPSFKLELAAKDARLVLEAIERHDLPLPMLEAIRSQLEEAAREHGDKDM